VLCRGQRGKPPEKREEVSSEQQQAWDRGESSRQQQPRYQPKMNPEGMQDASSREQSHLRWWQDALRI
jgi:hypothetical protein